MCFNELYTIYTPHYSLYSAIEYMIEEMNKECKKPDVIIKEMGNRLFENESENIIIIDYPDPQGIEARYIEIPKDFISTKIIECEKPEKFYFQFEISIPKKELKAVIPAYSFDREWQGEYYYYDKYFSEEFAYFLYNLKRQGGILDLKNSSIYEGDPCIKYKGARKYIDCERKVIHNLDDFVKNLKR